MTSFAPWVSQTPLLLPHVPSQPLLLENFLLNILKGSWATGQKGNTSSAPRNFLSFPYVLSQWMVLPCAPRDNLEAEESSLDPTSSLKSHTTTGNSWNLMWRFPLPGLGACAFFLDAFPSFLYFTNSYTSFKTQFQGTLYFGDLRPPPIQSEWTAPSCVSSKDLQYFLSHLLKAPGLGN